MPSLPTASCRKLRDRLLSRPGTAESRTDTARVSDPDTLADEPLPAKPYKYEPLPPSEDHQTGDGLGESSTLWTRLLAIHPGEFTDDIHVDLHLVRLVETTDSPRHHDQSATPRFQVAAPETSALRTYEALSYVWGDSAKDPGVVFIGSTQQTMAITRKLDEALRHLRHRDRARVMWVDALCIDQQNDQERSRQVRYMCHIYWSTPRVVVWLGPAADDSDHALEKLFEIGSRIRVHWLTAACRGLTDQDDMLWNIDRLHTALPLSAADWTAIQALMDRPWFTRLWIRQEVFKARDEAVVHCGTRALPWEPFRRGLFRLTFGHRARNVVPRNAIRGVQYPVAELRELTSGALCSDKRDYIYSLLGVLLEEKTLGIVPDYSKSAAEIYRDVAVRYIQLAGNLQLLQRCGNEGKECGPYVVDGRPLPTWVPDFSATPAENPYTYSVLQGATPLQSCWKYVPNDVLCVAGLTRGVIRDFIDLDVSSFQTFQATIQAVVPTNATKLPYPGGGNTWDAYRIALCAEMFSDQTSPANTHIGLTYESSKTAMESIMRADKTTAPAWPPGSPESCFWAIVARLARDSRFFVSCTGLVGWAPAAARPGDQLVVLLGSDLPMLLRPTTPTEHEQFQVVGPCFLQGFMYGEAWLGSLPDGLRPMRHLASDETKTPHHMELYHPDTRETLLRDPRLASLPIRPVDLERWAQEGVPASVAPDVLRSHGLEIREFNLV